MKKNTNPRKQSIPKHPLLMSSAMSQNRYILCITNKLKRID